MGSDPSHPYAFQKNQWELIEKNPQVTLWRNRKDPNLHIEQYDLFTRGNNESNL